jgi:hypothetical protein
MHPTPGLPSPDNITPQLPLLRFVVPLPAVLLAVPLPLLVVPLLSVS